MYRDCKIRRAFYLHDEKVRMWRVGVIVKGGYRVGMIVKIVFNLVGTIANGVFNRHGVIVKMNFNRVGVIVI